MPPAKPKKPPDKRPPAKPPDNPTPLNIKPSMDVDLTLLGKAITAENVEQISNLLAKARKAMREFRRNEPYYVTINTNKNIIVDSQVISLEDDEEKEWNEEIDYPYVQKAIFFPANRERNFTTNLNLENIIGVVKIDPGTVTSSHERVSLISTTLANKLKQRGSPVINLKHPYKLSTSLSGTIPKICREAILVDVEFNKVKDHRCHLKCIVTDLIDYDMLISFQDFTYLNMQRWLIEGIPTECLDDGYAPENERVNSPQLYRPLEGKESLRTDEITLDEFERMVRDIPNELPEPYKEQLIQTTLHFRDIFIIHQDDFKPGEMKVPPYKAKTKSTFYGVRNPLRLSGSRLESLNQEIQKCLDQGVLIPTHEATATSNAFTVYEPWKKEGKQHRLVIDYSVVNRLIEPSNQNTIPKVNDILQFVGSRLWLGEMDMKRAFWQMPLHKETQKLLAISDGRNTFLPTACPMGERNVPIVFSGERLRIFYHLRKNVKIYVDNDFIGADTPKQLVDVYKQVFETARKYNMKYNLNDTKLAVKSLDVLGFTIKKDEQGRTTREPIKKHHENFLQKATPTSASQMRSFLGLARVLAPFSPGLSVQLAPLNKLAHKANAFKLEDTHLQLIEKIKQQLTDIDKLYFYDPRYPIIAATDACNEGIGGVIYQVDDDGEYRILNWFSEPFSTQSRRNWPINKKECYAMNELIVKNHEFLVSVPFILLTDHRNLVFLTTQQDPILQRIQNNIMQYNVELRYVPGVANVLPDKMSRVFSENKQSIKEFDQEMEEPYPINDNKKIGKHIRSDSIKFIQTKRPSLTPKRVKLLASYHGLFSGHHGWEQMYNLMIAHRHYWPEMRADIQDYVKNCIICQKMRPLKDTRDLPIRQIPKDLIPRPIGQTIEVDLCHMPTSKEGYETICVMVDIPSKFMFLIPQRNKEAITTAASLMKYLGFFGTPNEIRSDRGSEFINSTWEALLTLLKIRHHYTAPHRSQAHGRVENANRQLVTLLRSTLFILGEETINWPTYLPLVQWLLNRVIHEDTGVSAADWVYGLKGPQMHTGITLMQPQPIEAKRRRIATDKIKASIPLETFQQEFERIQNLLTHAIINQLAIINRKKLLKIKARNEKKGSFVAKPGDYVLYKDPTAYNKLAPRRLGPWIVISYNKETGTYTLEDKSDDKIYENIHESYVYPLLIHGHNLDPEELLKIAAQDRCEETPIGVIDHTFDNKATKEVDKLLLKIEWQDGYIRLHPWKTVKNLACVHWYVYTHTDLEHWAKLIKKGKRQTEAYYSELKAQFEKDEKEKNEIATMSKETTTIIHDNNPKLIDEITLKVHEKNENNEETKVKQPLQNILLDKPTSNQSINEPRRVRFEGDVLK